MDDRIDRDRMRERLNDLDKRIAEMRRKLGHYGSLDETLDQQWDRIVNEHATMSNRLDAHRGPETPANFHADVSKLERDLERWGIALEEMIAGDGRRQG